MNKDIEGLRLANKKKLESNRELPETRFVDQSMEIGMNGSKLSTTDAVLVALSRILLSSPDLLLINNLLDALDIVLAERVMGVFRELVSKHELRCLQTEAQHCAHHDKPKTIILISKRAEIEILADRCLTLTETAPPLALEEEKGAWNEAEVPTEEGASTDKDPEQRKEKTLRQKVIGFCDSWSMMLGVIISMHAAGLIVAGPSDFLST